MAELASLVDVAFRSRVDPRLQVEVLELSDVLRVAPRGFTRHEFSLALVPTACAVSVDLDFEHVEVGLGTVLQVLPGQVLRWPAGDAAVQAALLVVHRDVAAVWGFDPPLRPGTATLLALQPDERRLLLVLLDAVRAAQDDFDGSDSTLRTMELLVGAIATQFAAIRNRAKNADSATSGVTKSFLTFVASTGRTRTVDEAASTLGYSVRHLARVVRRETGRPPNTWLQERTLLEAKRLLAHTDLTATAIGTQLGFVDASHFSRAFKRGTGSTALSFRRAHGEA